MAFIYSEPLSRDAYAKAHVLLKHKDNAYCVERVERESEGPVEYYLFNSLRNLAQEGVGNEITRSKAMKFLDFHLTGVGYPVNHRFGTMEEARKAVGMYHVTRVSYTFDIGHPDRPTEPIADAQRSLHMTCTCKYYKKNAIYCTHILLVVHFHGAIDIGSDTAVLAPVRRSGRPKKRGQALQIDHPQGPRSHPTAQIGNQVYKSMYGIGLVQSYDCVIRKWCIVYPPTADRQSVSEHVLEPELIEIRSAYENRNWI